MPLGHLSRRERYSIVVKRSDGLAAFREVVMRLVANVGLLSVLVFAESEPSLRAEGLNQSLGLSVQGYHVAQGFKVGV